MKFTELFNSTTKTQNRIPLKFVEKFKVPINSLPIHRKRIYLIKINKIPEIVGGSIVFGPKNDGISLDVVTGVFKSPVCASAIECD